MSDAFAPHAHDDLAINALRFLAIDMVQKANSGHPGAPMGQAAMAYTLWSRHLNVCPSHPDWLARDRFVLSCGHASALQYGLLHLAGYDLPIEELQNFRQLGSKTPGHPEYGHTEGVDMTTGPLGQGLSTAVGMAIAQKQLSNQFDRDDFTLFDHDVWVIASDGDLMEGIASEASSFAGHLGLGRLNVLYDANQITIDGTTDLSFTEDVLGRYASYGWHTALVEDGNDCAAVDAAIRDAKADPRPSMIQVRTHIGYGSPNKQDSSASHGAPLGEDEVVLTRTTLGWEHEPFEVPEGARDAFAPLRERGEAHHEAWKEQFERYREAHPDLADEFDRRAARALPDGLDQALPRFTAADGPLATRKASGKSLIAVAEQMPELLGGSADLAGSNNTMIPDEPAMNPGVVGRNFNFGVREHAMGAILNGMALSGLLRPYGGTFLIFADYFRPAIRLAALMNQPAIYVLTHDSIYVGEDGPTHQPVSHLAGLRAIPNMLTLRPADANETAAAWMVALRRTDGPTALVLTRQSLPVLEDASADGVTKGGYVLSDARGDAPDSILVATGSEVSLALDAQAALRDKGHDPRVVSLPSWELFEAQDADYREQVLPRSITRRLAIEAGHPLGWERYVGLDGGIVAQRTFGASAPGAALGEHFGFTVENVVEQFEALA